MSHCSNLLFWGEHTSLSGIYRSSSPGPKRRAHGLVRELAGAKPAAATMPAGGNLQYYYPRVVSTGPSTDSLSALATPAPGGLRLCAYARIVANSIGDAPKTRRAIMIRVASSSEPAGRGSTCSVRIFLLGSLHGFGA